MIYFYVISLYNYIKIFGFNRYLFIVYLINDKKYGT